MSGEVPRHSDQSVDPSQVEVDGEPIDPETLIVMLNKPCGYTCSTRDAGQLVYELFPERWSLRRPALSSVGRLDKDTSGLLLFTDDGQLLHRLTSPKHNVAKIYEAHLARPLRGDEKEIFASGSMLLEGEETVLKPAILEVIAPAQARVTVTEGRYHQVRRMFAAVGNHVEQLHRSAIGALVLDKLPEGEFRLLTADQLDGAVFSATAAIA